MVPIAAMTEVNDEAILHMNRHYPGFLAACSILLLRVAIGWHFLNEGTEKYESFQEGTNPFSAEIYLRNSAGPLAPFFRSMIPDVDGKDVLDTAKLKAVWKADVARIADHYGFDESQRAKAAKVLADNELWLDQWWDNPENAEKRKKYTDELTQVESKEQDPKAMSYELERCWESRRSLEADRKSLSYPLVERGKTVQESVAKVATPNQLQSAGPTSRPHDQLWYINQMTTYGLIAIGICLITGFLTPFAALCAALFLAMIYLSIPPWPGMPPNPKAEGHYWIVSKNLVELLACFVIATTPSGYWCGIDALAFGWLRRRRLATGQSGQAISRADQELRKQPVPLA
jgi:uncharacterized membrane protein YphA (DoxX/SURF4 family)